MGGVAMESADDFKVEPDPRMVHFIGGFDENGRPTPMSPGALRRVAESWPRATSTPPGVAGLLKTSRDLFVQSYFVYEFLVVSALWSLHAGEAALRAHFDSKNRFEQLINRAQQTGLLAADEVERLDAGRLLRNELTHAAGQDAWTFGMSAGVVRASHEIVFRVFEDSAG
jgi:hypothetical protein